MVFHTMFLPNLPMSRICHDSINICKCRAAPQALKSHEITNLNNEVLAENSALVVVNWR